MRRLLDLRMADGSRHFGGLPERVSPLPFGEAERELVAGLPGATLTRFLCDGVTEAWIDFVWLGGRYALNNQGGDWWFFVDDPATPDERLLRVLDHFEAWLAPHAAHARRAGELRAGRHRVVVLEADGRVNCSDHDDFAGARQHADDAASETEDGPVIAWVVDEHFELRHVGRHYAGR